jgi:hypothetical protein
MAANALYLLASRAGQPWASCLVIDVSDSGAGLELRGDWPASSHEHMLLRLLSPSSNKPVTFCGALRHQHVTESGTLRVGVEFIDAPIPEPITNKTGNDLRNGSSG